MTLKAVNKWCRSIVGQLLRPKRTPTFECLHVLAYIITYTHSSAWWKIRCYSRVKNKNNKNSSIAEMAAQYCTSRNVAFEWGCLFWKHSFSVLPENVTTYDYHLRLIGKRVVDFLLALIELFSLGVTVEALREIIGWKSAISLQRGPVDPKFHVEGVASTDHSFSPKTRLNALSYGIKTWTDLSTVLSQFTRVTDRQTDRRTDRRADGQAEFSSLDRVCIPCSAVKMDPKIICYNLTKLVRFRWNHIHVNLKTNQQELAMAYCFKEIHDNVNFINIWSTPLKDINFLTHQLRSRHDRSSSAAHSKKDTDQFPFGNFDELPCSIALFLWQNLN